MQPEVISTREPDITLIPSPIQSNDDWCEWIAKLNIQGMAKALAVETQWVSSEGLHLQLHCDPKKASLYNTNSEARLLDSLSAATGIAHSLHIRIAPTDDTPAQRHRVAQAADIAAATVRLEEDTGSKAIQGLLNASLVGVTIISQ